MTSARSLSRPRLVIPEASFSSTRLGRLKIPDAVDLDADPGRIGERDRLGLAVPRELAGDQELDADAGLGVAEVLAAGERRDITQALELLVDGLETLAGDEDIDIDSVNRRKPCLNSAIPPATAYVDTQVAKPMRDPCAWS